ncbi:Regulatory protein LuxR [hydrothermal vent metagenome]|uniref:Regulatory protein LuxR n=1 Tax=hydrothermal vent metagenome TaxID=652676 RepID=A0A3B0X7M2_9ZZZZ
MKIQKYLSTSVLIAAIVFFAYDIISDLYVGTDSYIHITLEIIICLAITAILFRELKNVASLNKTVEGEKEKTARLSGQLFEVMNKQFGDWQLSPSENEVALLLIKGLSMKEISEIRNVKEKTVRQQATQIYAKSGCAGRHELAAHFIEDLMLIDKIN